jgi:hypothetical protein
VEGDLIAMPSNANVHLGPGPVLQAGGVQPVQLRVLAQLHVLQQRVERHLRRLCVEVHVEDEEALGVRVAIVGALDLGLGGLAVVRPRLHEVAAGRVQEVHRRTAAGVGAHLERRAEKLIFLKIGTIRFKNMTWKYWKYCLATLIKKKR